MEQLLTFEYIVSVLLSGISLGGQLALIAIGYTMVYGILRLINFAHGDVFMVAGLMGVYLSASLPIYIAVPAVIAMTMALGFFIERAAYKPLRSAPRMSVMISAIGVSYLLQNLATYVTGGQPMTYPTIGVLNTTINIAGGNFIGNIGYAGGVGAPALNITGGTINGEVGYWDSADQWVTIPTP